MAARSAATASGPPTATTTRRITRIYRNDGAGGFTDIGAGLTGVSGGSVAWGDYDSDGRMDILLTGNANDGSSITRIYHNVGGGAFRDIGASLPGISNGTGKWGDYDNDGNLDILLAGSTGTQDIAKIFRNDGNGSFAEVSTSLMAVGVRSAVWGDYDGDGDLDVFILRSAPPAASAIGLYRNDGNGVFTYANLGVLSSLTGKFGNSSASFGDYDNDGDIDLLVTGYSVPGTPFDQGLATVSRMYRNDSAEPFGDIGTWIAGSRGGSTAWGDYDSDGRLDMLVTGGESSLTEVYRNNQGPANSPPSAPTNLIAQVGSNSVTFGWGKATDSETPSDSLTYNLRVGTSHGSGNIVSPMSDATTGYHRLPASGNVGHQVRWTLKDLPIGTYYWTVQAIDNGFAASAFAPEQSFQLGPALFNPVRNGGNFSLNVQTAVGKMYTLEFKNSLSESCWTSGATVVGDGVVKTLTDSLASASQMFYRVRVN